MPHYNNYWTKLVQMKLSLNKVFTSCTMEDHGLPTERIQIPANDYQDLNTLVAIYITAYDDWRNGKLKQEQFKKLFHDLFTKDVCYGYEHVQFPDITRSMHGIE